MKVGSIVECIDNGGVSFRFPLVVGKLYTVESIREYDNGVGVTLSEINKNIVVLDRETGAIWKQSPPFSINRFREVLPPVGIEELTNIKYGTV